MKQVQALRLRRAIPPLLPATGLEVLGRYSLPSSITLRFLLELPALNSLRRFSYSNEFEKFKFQVFTILKYFSRKRHNDTNLARDEAKRVNPSPL